MAEKDLILNPGHNPQYEEILTYINDPALTWWKTLNSFIQEKYKIKPKVTYSRCSMQKGWNVKYHKSGKSICTLYPDKNTFIVLIVIKLELAHIITAMESKFDQEVLHIVDSARPFNGTKGLMIPIESEGILKNVQELLVLKQNS
ncbi:MAG: DUF3788 domain-containing protein [Syntrophomonas sp.]